MHLVHSKVLLGDFRRLLQRSLLPKQVLLAEEGEVEPGSLYLTRLLSVFFQRYHLKVRVYNLWLFIKLRHSWMVTIGSSIGDRKDGL